LRWGRMQMIFLIVRSFKKTLPDNIIPITAHKWKGGIAGCINSFRFFLRI
jgi:hypothetical protein